MSDFGLIALGAAEAYTDKKISQIPIPKAWLGNTTTALSEGSTANPITIDNKPVTAESGNIAAYDDTEYIFTGTVWQKFGGKFTDLTDVNISSPDNGQYIKYDATSNKYVKGFKRTVLSATLATGATTVTFTDSAITNTALYRVFTDPFVEYDDITQSGTTITITFTEQESAVGVKLVIEEE